MQNDISNENLHPSLLPPWPVAAAARRLPRADDAAPPHYAIIHRDRAHAARVAYSTEFSRRNRTTSLISSAPSSN